MSEPEHVVSARAVYDASAERYVEFVGTVVSAATEGPIDRALLAAFVELVEGAPGSLVADLGCGPGRVAAYLAARGLDVVGVDLSPALLEAARDAHPGIRFERGRLDDLPCDDGSLTGAVYWYSIIYTPLEHLDVVFAELLRVLAPGGWALLAFQAGTGDALRLSDAHGTGLPLTRYAHALEDVSDRLEHAGFTVHATARREPEFAHESTPQAFVIVRSPGPETDEAAGA